MITLIETGDSLGRPEVIAVVRHDSAPPLATSGADYRSQLFAGMLAAAHGVSDFFPGDSAELKSGEIRPERVQPLSFQRRFDNRTWVTSSGLFIPRSAEYTA